MTAWTRLQALSCAHNLELWLAAGKPRPIRGSHIRRSIAVPEPIRDNVKILGRGDEEEIKSRVLWYLTFHGGLFSRVSKSGWRIV